MAKRNRSTLKNYFRKGALPNADHFSDLIDSCLNTLEEGFDKSADAGFKISAVDKPSNLISFYRTNEPDNALWTLKLGDESQSLMFDRNQPSDGAEQTDQDTLLCLTQQRQIGINCSSPSEALEVDGNVKSSGRVGRAFVDDTPATVAVKADGAWHAITPSLEGCQGLEVVAGVGVKHSGRYALLKAVALNTCNPTHHWWNIVAWFKNKRSIKSQHAYYGSRGDKLQLRWVSLPNKRPEDHSARPYQLQIRSNTDYGANVNIRFHITKLWLDPFMELGLEDPEPTADD